MTPPLRECGMTDVPRREGFAIRDRGTPSFALTGVVAWALQTIRQAKAQHVGCGAGEGPVLEYE